MLGELEKSILKLMSQNLLITKGELAMKFQQANINGAETSIQKLVQMGYVEKVESLGTCYVLTQQGQRAVKGD